MTRLVQCREQQTVHAAEVIEDQRLVEVPGACDRTRACAREPLGLEDLEGGPDYPLPDVAAGTSLSGRFEHMLNIAQSEPGPQGRNRGASLRIP